MHSRRRTVLARGRAKSRRLKTLPLSRLARPLFAALAVATCLLGLTASPARAVGVTTPGLAAGLLTTPAMQQVVAGDKGDGDYFGTSIAISGDIAVIGAPFATRGSVSTGAAYVFTRAGDGWTEQSELIPSGGVAGERFGSSVALDGDTAIVGALWADAGSTANAGAAYVFTYADGTWTQRARLTAPAEAIASGAGFGSAATVDGTTAVIGSMAATVEGVSSAGCAFVFAGSGSSWEQVETLKAAAPTDGEYFGMSVDLDGDTLIIGASNSSAGVAYVFERTNDIWSEQDELRAPGGAVNFGRRACLDGDTALVSSNDGPYVFTRAGDDWSQQALLVASEALPDDGFGRSLALSGDTAVIGASSTEVGDYSVGAAYVFTRSGSTWTEGDRFMPSNVDDEGYMGSVVALDGRRAMAGAPEATVDSVTYAGAVYAFQAGYEAPTVAITGADSAWHAAASLTVTASVDPALSLAALDYSTDGGSTWTAIPGAGSIRALGVSAPGITDVSVRAKDSRNAATTTSATVKVDTVAPSTEAYGADDAWHRTPVTLVFTPTVGPSGLQSVEYKVGDGSWTAVTPESGAYVATISNNGENAISYRSTSNAGVSGAAGTCTVKIDTAKPVAKAKKATLRKGRRGTLRLYVAKTPAGCGNAKVTIKVYKGAKLKKSFTTKQISVDKWVAVSWKCTLPKGRYMMKLSATDSLGNKQAKAGAARLVVR